MKLENSVNCMKISAKNPTNCDVCVKGKMCEYRSKVPDARANKPLDFDIVTYLALLTPCL